VIDPFSQTGIRFFIFFGVLIAMGIFEMLYPRRALTVDKVRRWVTNLTIIALNSLVVRVMAALSVPVAAIAAAHYAEDHGIGLMNTLYWPDAVEFILAVVALDLAVWAQHVASHKVPLLWRLHQMHHADPDIDVTTGIRFHPIEIALSMLWKIACVLALGASPLAVFVFEVILNATALFSHSNVALPQKVDSILRWIIVTPDMHRVHHSVERHEHDSNYGFNLSVWDRLFGTYRDRPEKGHEHMTIGLKPYQNGEPSRLRWSLTLPFRQLRGRT
jgi:sterol desaturase/sphingolipid hydroxylase (fatty acid hydroxylase superfamily)